MTRPRRPTDPPGSSGHRSLPALLLVLAALLVPACGGGGGGGGGGGVLLSYASAPFANLRVGFAIDVAPTTAIAATGFSVTSGALPAGLALDAATGVIAGRPLVAGSGAATVEATDGTTTVSASLAFDVLPPPASRLAVVANAGDDTLSVHSLDPASGLLRFENWRNTGAGPAAVATTPDGGFVYTANAGSGDVSAFALDTTNGALEEVPGSPFAASADPLDLAVDPLARFAWVLCDAGGAPVVHQYTLGADGALAPLPTASVPVGAGARRIAADPLGRFVQVSFGGALGMVQTFAVGAAGDLTAGAAAMAGSVPGALAGTPDGAFLYVANEGSGDLSAFAVDPVTGALASLGAAVRTSGGAAPLDLAMAADGSTLLVSLDGGGVQSFAVAGDGALASNGALATPGIGSAARVALDHACGAAFAVDPAAGALAPLTVAGDGTLGAGAVPEIRLRPGPSDLAMVPGLSEVRYATRRAYAGNANDDDLTTFDVDPASGALTARPTTVATGQLPNWAVVHPREPYLYSVNGGGFANAVEVFRIDGDGTPVSHQVTPHGGATAWSLHFEPSARYAVGINTSIAQVISYEVADDGMLAVFVVPFSPGPLSAPAGAAVDPTGRFAYATRSTDDLVHQFALDPLTGVVGELADPTDLTGDTPIAAAVDPTGRFAYVACFGSPGALWAYSIDAATGELTALAGSPVATDGQAIAVVCSPDGRFAYVANRGASPSVQTFALDPQDGTPASANVRSLAGIPFQIRLNGAGDVLYVTRTVTAGGVEVFALDANGVPSSIDFEPAGDSTQSFAVQVVLE